jgi:hypothetical protein
MAVAFVVVISAGVVGLAYETRAEEPRQPQAGDAQRPKADDLEALRLEVEALRKGLQVTRERVKTLEAEVQALRRIDGAAPSHKGAAQEPATNNRPENALSRQAIQEHAERALTAIQLRLPDDNPLTDAEAALKAIREARDTEEQRRATDALEKALKRMKEREKPTRNPQGH